MRIVHFGHACVLVDTGSARLLFDPGAFSSGFESERNLDAILITHQHFDHLDPQRLPALAAANPDAEVVVDPGSVDQVAGMGLDSARTVRPGDAVTVAGVTVHVVGGEHAVIHRDIPVIPNTGYVLEHGAFYHPGDSFFVPEQRIDVLGVPTGAPWLKAAEAVDFIRAVSPRVAVPIHEAVLSKPELHHGLFERLAPDGTTVRVLDQGEPTEI